MINTSTAQKLSDELKEMNMPLDESACTKTAEVYDYENRIYRVDLTSRGNMATFSGKLDLAFILDVSASMLFPSTLSPKSGYSGVSLRNINTSGSLSGNTYTFGGKTYNIHNSYYIISDEPQTATVYEIFYRTNYKGNDGTTRTGWFCIDASKDKNVTNASGSHTNCEYISTSSTFKAKTYGNNDPRNNDHNYTYQIYEDGDPGHNRAYYLEQSLNGAAVELSDIRDVLSVTSGGKNDLDIEIGWNTFCNYLTNQNQYNFQSVAPGGFSLNYDTSNFGGGTSTDMALLDAAGMRRSDVRAYAELFQSTRVNRYWTNPITGNSGTSEHYPYAEWEVDYQNLSYSAEAGRGFQWHTQENRYAVLITDGAPQRGGHSIDFEFIREAASKLKAQGVTLITIGLSMDNVDGGSDLLFDIANVGDDNYPLFYSAKTGDELDGILNQIIRGLISDAIVVGTITDWINEAFYPVNKENGKPLEANDIIDLSGKWLCNGENNLTAAQKAAGYGKVSVLQDGTYQVEWRDQSISCEEPGWQGTVYVKAKEDLLGGNSLMTNKDDATIVATGYKMKETDTTILRFKNSPASTNNQLTTKSITRESPLVNVNELGFNGNSTEWTVYLGEEVDPKEELKKLYENILVQEVVNSAEDTDNDTYEIPDTLVYNSQDSLHYALAPDDFTDQREGDTAGTAVTFKLMDLIRELIDQQIAESEAAHQADPSNPEKAAEYAFWNAFITVDENQNEILDWDHFIEESLKENGFSIPYHVYGISDEGSIKITLEKEIVEEEKIYTQEEGQNPVEATLQTSPHLTKAVSELDEDENYIPVEKYTLTAFYSPDYDVLPKGQGGKKSNDLVHVGTYGTMYQGHAAGTETSTNVHEINVFVRDLKLIKTGMDGDAPITSDTAEFTIYRKATEEETETIQAAEAAAEAARRQSFIDEGKESEYDPADAAPSRMKKRTELEPEYDPTADPDYNVTGLSASEIQALQTQMKNQLFVDDPELKATTSRTDGTVIIEDLPMSLGNIYYMVETKAPDGYVYMPEALKIYIDYTDIFWEIKDEAADRTFITETTVYPGTTTKVIDSESGKPGIAYNWDQEYMEDGETENAKIQISSLTAQNWQVYYKPVTQKVIVADTERLVPVSNQFYIRNSPGIELPSTGGPGILVFMIPGMVLIVIAATILLKQWKYY